MMATTTRTATCTSTFTINTMHPETVMETISVPNIPLNF